MRIRLGSIGWRIRHNAVSEAGQGLVEYGMILTLVAVLCVAGLGLLQSALDTNISDVANGL